MILAAVIGYGVLWLTMSALILRWEDPSDPMEACLLGVLCLMVGWLWPLLALGGCVYFVSGQWRR